MKQLGGIWVPDSEHYLARWLEEVPGYADGYDEYLFQFVRDLRVRRVALDVGANVGLWTRKLAQCFKAVYAFEPVDDVRSCLIANADILNNVFINSCAIGAAVGRVQMTRRSPDTTFKTHVLNGVEGITRLRSIDSLVLSEVDLIKIDTEGYDAFVLRGAAATIRASRPLLIFEVKPGVSKKRYGVDDAVHFALLDELGYEVIHSERGNYVARSKDRQ